MIDWRHLTWTCHVCGDERPDDKISVASASFTIVGDAKGQVNRRYCNDRPACEAEAQPMVDREARRLTSYSDPTVP